jgi:hypothetical protein
MELDGPPWPEAGDEQGTWIVQTGKEGKENDYGVVSDGHGFEDSPDCERISGGVNSKGPRAVAIGRQANLLQWGFYCAPDRMTASARKVFLNAIVWMRQFDGERPLVEKRQRGRSWLEQYADAYAKLSPADRAKTGENSYAGYLTSQFPADVLQGDDVPARMRAWYAANEEWVAMRDRRFELDADLAARKVSNRKPEFFALLLQLLDADPADATARRLAAKYLPDVAPEAAAIRKFVADHQGRLFFSDAGGFRWFVAGTPKTAPPTPR